MKPKIFCYKNLIKGIAVNILFNARMCVYMLALSILLSGNALEAQTGWPNINQQTRPWARWWWEGSAVNKTDLTKVMEKYSEAGLGGLEITPIYGVKGEEAHFIPFLSEDWMKVFEHTLQEAKRLDLGIDLANATGWPFGGPWVDDKDASKSMVYKTYQLQEGQSLQEPIIYIQMPFIRQEGKNKVDPTSIKEPLSANKNLQVLAIDQLRFKKNLPLIALIAYGQKGRSINLLPFLNKQNQLNWKAPKGQGTWIIYAIFEGMHGKMVERAAPGGEGFVIDHFSASALNNYLHHFDQAFHGNSLNNLRGFFNDSYEVDDAQGQADFTPEFFNIFQKARGYDLRNYLPYLFAGPASDSSSRILSDYRQTIGELLLNNFTKNWELWAKSKDKLIRNQSHGSPANILDLYGAIDIPETEGRDVLRFKFASSAANVLGKPLVSSESATWLNDHFESSLGDVKKAMDQYFLGGVNHTFYHGIAYSPLSATWPGWLFYASVHFTPASPQWNNFHYLNNYVAHCQSILQSGKPDNDILQYFPIFDSYAQKSRTLLNHYDGMKGFENSDFEQNAKWMLTNGYAFDFISDHQIQLLKTAEGNIQSPGGKYKTVLISDAKYMPLTTLRKLLQLAENGANILFYKSLPTKVPGLSKLQENEDSLHEIIHKLIFKESGSSGVSTAKWGKGNISVGDDLKSLLLLAKTLREPMVDIGLSYARRSYKGGFYYFILNQTDSSFENWLTLSIAPKDAKSIVLYDPMTGNSGIARTRLSANGEVQIYLQLSQKGSCLLKTANDVLKGNDYVYYAPGFGKETNKTVFIKGSWNLSFERGGPVLPKAMELNKLISWTDLKLEDAYFSGVGVYKTHFAMPDIKSDYYQLNLGIVKENAEVWLNGKNLGALLGPDYSLIFPGKELQNENELVIKVSNLMINRIHYMEEHHEEYRKFYNINFPAHSKQNADANGLFTSLHQQLTPSGLLGPVSLTPVAKM